MKKFIFTIKLSRLLSVFFLLLGGVFFSAGLDMIFFHRIIPLIEEKGYVFASWFCLIIGGLVGFTGVQNCISPMILIAVSKKGIELKASPGPTRRLTLIPWQDIEDIGQGQIIMSGSKGGRVIHKTIKFMLKAGSPSANARLTDGMLRWGASEVNFDSIYFKVKLESLINTLKMVMSQPDKYEELNADVGYFIRHNTIE